MNTASCKRGMTRLYVVAWILWAIYCVAHTVGDGADDLPANLPTLGVACLAMPGILLLVLRWVFDGFTNGGHEEAGPSKVLLVVMCLTSLLASACDKTTAPKPPTLQVPELAFTRWSAITIDNGVGYALGWCKNVGTLTARHVLASSCLDNTARLTEPSTLAPGDSANFWHPAVDSSGVWVYPSCTPHIGGDVQP